MPSRFLTLAVLLVGWLSIAPPGGLVGANDPRPEQKKVDALVSKISAAVVGVKIGNTEGSGVIVKEGFVLTAGQVSGQPGRACIILLPNGKELKGKSLGRNSSLDSGLLKIEEKGMFLAMDMGESAKLKEGQWVIALGHSGGFRPDRKLDVRLGQVKLVKGHVIQTDCPLVMGDQGGPLFDMDGKVVGIHSRKGQGIAQNYHVPIDAYVQSWNRLVKGEVWSGTGKP
jgi:serine protease Do